MKRVRSVLFLSVCAALRPNSGRRKTSVAANTKTEAAPLLAPTTTASLDETAVDAQRELSTPSLDAAPADVKGNRAPPKKAVTTPSDAKNNVLKLDWAKNKPCAFTPAALEPTEQRSYKDETDYPELALKYWADPRIHGWGNVGSSGAVHAFLAPTRGAASFTPSTRRSLLLTQVHGGPRRLRVRRPRHARRRVEINFLATHAIEATFSTQAQRGLGRRRRGAEHRRRAARDELRRPRHGHRCHG